MAVEFLDSGPSPLRPDQPPGEPSPSAGVDFLPPAGVEFLNDEPVPAKPAIIASRFLNPDYQPTLAEFKAYQQARKSRTVGEHLSDDLDAVTSAVSGVLGTVKGGVSALFRQQGPESEISGTQTILEGVARGTKRDIELAAKLLPSGLLTTFGPGHSSFDQYAAARVADLQQQQFRSVPLTPENFKSMVQLKDVPPELMSKWRAEYDEKFVPETQFASFMDARQSARDEIKLAKGETNLVPEIYGKADPALAEAQSLVTSPMALIPFGKALTPARTLARDAAAGTLKAGGRAAEVTGQTVSRVASLPERIVGKGFEWLSGSEAAGKAAETVVKRGSVGATLVSPALAVPGLTETAAAITAGKVGGKVLEGSGAAMQAAGRAVGQGPSRFGLFNRIAKDAQAPQWLRRAANSARPFDPAVSLAGAAAGGAAEGAAIGLALGGATGGEEGAAAGLGAGLALGGGGGLAGRIIGARRYQEGLKDRDIAAWLAAKPTEEVANIANLNLSRDQALTLSDVERLARGIAEPGKAGDIEFRYLGGKDFEKLFGVGKGAQTVEGDRPVVFVNTGYKGARSAFHETMHALDALEGFTPQREALNRILFDQTLPDGQVLSKGLYSAADVVAFRDQYRARLNQSARAEFDLLPPEAQQARIMGEVRSEAFANMMSGRNTGSASVPASPNLASRNLKSRLTDTLLTADHDTMLGKMRRALESVGVTFDASGEPSELFFKNGRPLTNTPGVDAALRDYIRAKDQLTHRLIADDDGGETPSLVVRPQDLISKGNAGLISTFKDNDIFAHNPDGSVKMLGGVPVLLSEREIRLIQSKRVDAMLDALKSVPNIGETGIVSLKPNGAWEGRWFSDKQLAAFDALPDDVLSSSMKSKLRDLNELARSDGQQIVLDYNAALKGGKYSSGIAPTTRAAVPLTFNISKAGNFYMATLDTSHFFRKLGEWRKSKPKAFEPWGGDIDAFMRDSFAYLDNHVNGRQGSVNLDSDPAMALHKKNVINDFFNVPKGVGNEDLNPVQLSTRANKDNLIRSRRFDRINRVTPGAGDKFPIRYELQKRNFLPAEPSASPFPETPGTLNAQMMLLKSGRKSAVLVTPGSPMPPIPASLRSHRSEIGTFIFDPRRVTPAQIDQAVANDTVGGLLGYGTAQRPSKPIGVVVVRDRTGQEVQSAVVDTGSLPGASAAAKAMASGGQTVRLESGQRVLQERQSALGKPPATAASSLATQRHIEAQALFDLISKTPGTPNLATWMAKTLLAAIDKRMNSRARDTRTAQMLRLADAASGITPDDMNLAMGILFSQGQRAVQAHLERVATVKALDPSLLAHRPGNLPNARQNEMPAPMSQ